MKKVLLPIMILCLFYPTFAQTVEPVVLVNVGLDSLKKVVEQKSEYHLYYIQNPNETPTKLSVSWNRTNFLDQLQSALHQAGCSLSQMGSMLFVIKGAGIISKLPDHYFSLSQEPEQDAASIASLMASYRNIEAGSANKIYTIGDPNTVSSGNRAILSGYIKNANTGEPITTASIVVPSTGTAVITDRHGFYRITVPLGKTDIVLKEYTFEETPVMLEVFADGTLDILMREKFYSLNEVVVSADAYQQRRTTHVGLEKIQVARIRHIPTVFGEADVLKVVLTLPGVKTVGESSGGFNVRGGATDQNLILFNGGTLYNPTHLFGLFSAFNPDVVSDIELYKSTIPAKYGGRISSVLEVNNRQGNSNKITGSAGIGLLTGKFHLEGPIIKEKTNFIVGARTTYSNWMLKMLPQNSGYRDGSADFSDVTASISQKINSNNTLYLYGYYSGDRFSFSQDTTYSYQNVNLAFKWRSNLGAKQNMTFSAGYDRYAHNVEEKANPVQAYDMRFELEQLNLKTNFDWHVSESHTVNYGINGVHYTLSPGSFLPHGPASIVTPDVIDRESGLELSLYLSDKW
ncbi:MAG: carboxypeptidase-like regulatory domain-containing protein, partial [Bacteroidales bacterium]|nr:carboxypeptidase-like regulatory domain-containing protein [Bacteroidales bacterium]